jgi:hypothetical protein
LESVLSWSVASLARFGVSASTFSDVIVEADIRER